MAYEANIYIQNVRADIFQFVSALRNIGWDYRNYSGLTEFLPVGDNGEYDWKFRALTDAELSELINEKQSCNETIGINFFFRNEKSGFSMLASGNDYNMSLCIYRKVLADGSTDIGWYHENIIVPLRESGIVFDRFTIDEITD